MYLFKGILPSKMMLQKVCQLPGLINIHRSFHQPGYPACLISLYLQLKSKQLAHTEQNSCSCLVPNLMQVISSSIFLYSWILSLGIPIILNTLLWNYLHKIKDYGEVGMWNEKTKKPPNKHPSTHHHHQKPHDLLPVIMYKFSIN